MKCLFLIHGPIYSKEVVSVIQRNIAVIQSGLGRNAIICLSLWDKDFVEYAAEFQMADRVCSVKPAGEAGSCSRRLQQLAISKGLSECADLESEYCLKIRCDWQLSDLFITEITQRLVPGYSRILVTNLFTRIEPFHLSDCCIYAEREIIRDMFSPGVTYYEDVFSPEVEFLRALIRRRRWPYKFDLESWMRFLREKVDLVDYKQAKIVWLKQPTLTPNIYNKKFRINADRGTGPIQAKVIPVWLWKFIKRFPRLDSLLVLLILLADCLSLFLIKIIEKKGGRIWNEYSSDNKLYEYQKPIVDR